MIFSGPLKYIKYFIEKILPTLSKIVEYHKYHFKPKGKPKYGKKKEKTYCLVCKKKADNKNIKEVALENKIGQQKSTCVDCSSKESTFLKPIKPIRKRKNSFYKL